MKAVSFSTKLCAVGASWAMEGVEDRGVPSSDNLGSKAWSRPFSSFLRGATREGLWSVLLTVDPLCHPLYLNVPHQVEGGGRNMFPGNAGQGTVADQAMGRVVGCALFTPGDTPFEVCFSAVCIGKACIPAFPSHVSVALLGSCPVDLPFTIGLWTIPPFQGHRVSCTLPSSPGRCLPCFLSIWDAVLIEETLHVRK